MKTLLTLLVATLAFLAKAADPILPNPLLTPGSTVTNSVVEICQHGYTKQVRNVPEHVKKQVFIEYFGSVPSHPGDYEIDHLISLELGGSNSISNLWPQSYTGTWKARVKDKLENYMAEEVRKKLDTKGTTVATALLKQFQSEISTNWTNAYVKHFNRTPK